MRESEGNKVSDLPKEWENFWAEVLLEFTTKSPEKYLVIRDKNKVDFYKSKKQKSTVTLVHGRPLLC